MGYSCYRASRCFLAHCCPANLHQMRLCVSAGGCKHPHCSSSTCRYHPIMFSESPQKHTKIQKYQNFTALKSMYCVSVLLLAPPSPIRIYKKGPRKKQWWCSNRVMSSQDSQMHVGSCCSSNCRTFMLVLIERSQTTQSIAVCYVWDCTAADQPAFPRGLPVHCWRHQRWARGQRNMAVWSPRPILLTSCCQILQHTFRVRTVLLYI